jgi:septal ring factor EnvC (AmiA/AmiB activator)
VAGLLFYIKYNPALEKIRTSFPNSEVAQLKAQVSRLKEELNAAQKAIAHLDRQNQALRQKVLTPEKCDRFLNESFRVTEFP